MKRILFANHAQFEGRCTNLGDWAIFEQMVEKLSPEIDTKKIEIIVPSADVEYTNSHYPVTAFKRGGILGIINTLKWIIKSDVVLIGGGEIVQDCSSMVYIPYQLIRPFIAKLFRKKLFAYAIGVGEEEEISWIGKLQSKIILNMFDVITVRDEKSYHVLKNYLKVNKPQIFLTADPALNLQKKKSKVNMDKDYFVISVRSVYHRNHNILPFSIRKRLGIVPSEYYDAIKEFKKEIAKLADNISKKYDYDIKFLNTYVGPKMSASDDKFTLDVADKMKEKKRVEIININNTPSQNKFVLAGAQLIISVPLHPLILGASENVPVFSLAYASKNRSFMNQIKHPEHIYKVEKIEDRIDVKQILTDIDNVMTNKSQYKKDLMDIVSYNKKLEQQNSQLLLELIFGKEETIC